MQRGFCADIAILVSSGSAMEKRETQRPFGLPYHTSMDLTKDWPFMCSLNSCLKDRWRSIFIKLKQANSLKLKPVFQSVWTKGKSSFLGESKLTSAVEYSLSQLRDLAAQMHMCSCAMSVTYLALKTEQDEPKCSLRWLFPSTWLTWLSKGKFRHHVIDTPRIR